MELNSVEEIIEDIRQGKMVILMDDEDRENEGDLMVAAECVTPEIINFMAREARGLICLPLTGQRCDELELPAMVQSSSEKFGTHFTVSIEAATGVTTGISAADRSRTIQVAIDPSSGPQDIVQPGHIFPLRAEAGGVLSRAGHTEAACDLARLAGLQPSCVIVEIMNDDGTMSRRPDLEKFAQKHDLKIGTIADLIHYRMMTERTIRLLEQRPISTPWGDFDLRVYEDRIEGGRHMTLSQGQFSAGEPALVRVHGVQTLRDLLGVETGGWSLHSALAQVNREGKGVVVLIDQHTGADIIDELHRLDNPERKRTGWGGNSSGAYVTIGTGAQILRDLGISRMRLMSSPIKFGGISGFDLEIEEYLQGPTAPKQEEN
ncbi:MAG: 3,4-dihydroxy-2-butanone-4-phosphate synthase [Natronospirillum sp.]|uniref:bifunctional 3,4-dihydroxy-2-butanone-4-phosphate synthase/GTP cyclohydrolase II n=1 Tax=Natronospirillum sp. TaxID=2812955 RepID=UPI0025E06299|nr:bifunctional 3,4-dihydroxy-2-butanone-4-phosphate synthase/GTP cyclohydrolase II [Natronospirillum sp.]MCH8550570.1 3,4-dihydroxy-2-butanone-4-phosphate synthase [Natronospirillum sp.]